MAEYQVIFQPSGRRGVIAEGTTLLAAARSLGVSIEALCGGARACGKCRVIVAEGKFEKLGINSAMSHLSPVTAEESRLLTEDERERGYRLACCAEVRGDIVLTVPEESRQSKQVILETGRERLFAIDPVVKAFPLTLSEATLDDARDDARRLLDGLSSSYRLDGLSLNWEALRALPETLRNGDWNVTAIVSERQESREVIRVVASGSAAVLGIAIDCGTTTLAAYLCDLADGEVLAKASRMNPQISYGEDILARISYARSEKGGREKLFHAIIDAVNDLAAELTSKAGFSMSDVYEMVLVGNTAIHHFIFDLDTSYLGRSPFAPAVRGALNVRARDLGIKIWPAANIHSLPIEAGFVGADNAAVILAESPYDSDELRLIIDIGTNGEIVLGSRGKLFSTSCATGPALEGAQIAFGMRAAPGAIEKIRIDDATKEPRYKVIGMEKWFPDIEETSARGICGSGILDAVAQMYRAGIVNAAGRINAKCDSKRIRKGESGKLEYVIAWASETAIHRDIVITQADIRAVQLAKAALYVGADYLLEKYGAERPDRVILAGAFGSYIDKESALTLGMFPRVELSRVCAVGNAAGDGARMALLSREKRMEIQREAGKVAVVETAVEPDFQKKFMNAIAFPPI